MASKNYPEEPGLITLKETTEKGGQYRKLLLEQFRILLVSCRIIFPK
jgi:hypothetical protein